MQEITEMEMFTLNIATSKVQKKVLLQEEELVLALKNQDSIGMKALVDMYSGSLGGVISRILQDSELSKDVLHEVIIRIWSTAHSYEKSKGRLFTWMINVARNYTIDIIRSKRYRNNRKNVSIEDHHLDVNTQIKIIFNPDTIGLKQLVFGLKPEYYMPLDLVFFKGYTHVEAAKELNLPLGTVKTRIRMAILELRETFNKNIQNEKA